MKRARRTAYLLSRLLMLSVLGLLLAGFAPYLIGWQAAAIVSGSMMPGMAPGDVAVAAPVAPDRLRPGQVILFTDPARTDRTLTHRLVSRQHDGTFTTKGDANASADPTPVPPTAIRGRIRYVVPYVGLPRYWLARGDWPQLVGCGAVLALLGLFAEDRKTAKRSRSETRAGGSSADERRPAEPTTAAAEPDQ
jgi:signal peptidase I